MESFYPLNLNTPQALKTLVEFVQLTHLRPNFVLVYSFIFSIASRNEIVPGLNHKLSSLLICFDHILKSVPKFMLLVSLKLRKISIKISIVQYYYYY